MHAADSPDALFTAIDHVGLAVSDLDAAIAFHRDVLGMELAHTEENPEQGVREAMMRIGDSHIQLLAPLTPDSTIAKFLDSKGPGMQQVAYRVADIDAVSTTLRDRGLRGLYVALSETAEELAASAREESLSA